MLDLTIKIVIKIIVGIEVKKIAEIEWEFLVDLGFVLGVKIEGRALIGSVMGFLVFFGDANFIDITVVDVRQKTAEQKGLSGFAGKLQAVSKAAAGF